MNVAQQREAAANEVISWVDTPFADNQHCKGAGVDCLYLLTESIGTAVNHIFSIPRYPVQWFMHVGSIRQHPEGVPRYATEEWYVEWLLANGFMEIPIGSQQRGDLVVSRRGEKVYCHGGMIVDWPTKIVHCTARNGRQAGVQVVSAKGSALFLGELRFFSWKEWHGQTA